MTDVVAVVGLGAMGWNLALNLADHGYRLVLHDISPSRMAAVAAEAGERGVELQTTPAALVKALPRPRRIIIMVPAGTATPCFPNSQKNCR